MASLWQKLSSSPSYLPTAFQIDATNTDLHKEKVKDFDKSHYFTVRVNEMFLSNGRQWFSEYSPMVMSIAEFMYDGKHQTVPFVVGPQLVQKHMKDLPQGMLFINTRVAGIHPYKGGKLSLTVLLSQVEKSNYFDKLLGFIEDTSSAIDFSLSLTSYVKVGRALMNGIESLFDLGGTKPIVGHRFEIDPDAGDAFGPGYYVLINAAEGKVDRAKLWVKDNALMHGKDAASARPMRDYDYVLYSITQSENRSDEDALGFIQVWRDIQTQLEKMPGFVEKDWDFVRGKMFELRSALLRSPDLTRQQALRLFSTYKERVLEAKEELQAFDLSKGAETKAMSNMAYRNEDFDEMVDVLNL